jgi:hypothetical protein
MVVAPLRCLHRGGASSRKCGASASLTARLTRWNLQGRIGVGMQAYSDPAGSHDHQNHPT